MHESFVTGNGGTAEALAGLRELVCSFDFPRLADGHTYVGIEPGYLIEVIDGFLGEPESVALGGDQTNLKQLRQFLVERIHPAHQEGLVAGRQYWHDGNRVYGSLKTEELHRLALQSASDDERLKGWFAEGFCFAYAFEEMEALRSEASG